MSIVLGRLQAISNAPSVYDYRWMHTLVENIAVDQKGNPCRLVENEDQWHFDQQVLRYHSGLHLVITAQDQLDNFLRNGWLKLTDSPIVIHRIKVALEKVFDWDDDRRESLLTCLSRWRDSPTIKYTTDGHAEYCIQCSGDMAAEEVREQLAGFGLKMGHWGPPTFPGTTGR